MREVSRDLELLILGKGSGRNNPTSVLVQHGKTVLESRPARSGPDQNEKVHRYPCENTRRYLILSLGEACPYVTHFRKSYIKLHPCCIVVKRTNQPRVGNQSMSSKEVGQATKEIGAKRQGHQLCVQLSVLLPVERPRLPKGCCPAEAGSSAQEQLSRLGSMVYRRYLGLGTLPAFPL